MAESKGAGSKVAGPKTNESKFGAIFDAPPQGEVQGGGRAESVGRTETLVRTVGRPPGKRSDPDYKQYSVLLKRQTHRKVSGLLRDRESDQDVSELVEQLLDQWLAEQA